ncbi:vesicle-associated membrane protein 4-like [Saccoglossus kowalevskii]|uniref:Vesicle-associated membrane protein 4-like n=1 Tax=Saccoglossus kowalevskii TaxID=10224 RepID=A0ABM0GIJ6_SACKO|nr:PREDICTED: vesicle-associated membrane protein 4-like [Saccoglossus kowalevskii]
MPPKFKKHLDEEDVYGSRTTERDNLLGDYHDDPEEDYNPFYSSGGNGSITKVQGQVDEVVNIMHDNINKVIDRGDKLDDLHDKSEELAINATHFKVTAKGLKKAMCWQACKMRLILFLVILVLLLVIIVPIIIKYMK